MKFDKEVILSEIKSHYKIKTDADFARFLGIKPQTLSSWYSRNVFDIELLYAKCVDIDANWLLTGKGEMLRNNSQNITGDNNVQTGNSIVQQGINVSGDSNSSIVGSNVSGSRNTIQHNTLSEKDLLLAEKDERIREKDSIIQDITKRNEKLQERLFELQDILLSSLKAGK